ncbi:hypothetical protein LEMLEM_LOCUS153 [Lemmus lemmus]
MNVSFVTGYSAVRAPSRCITGPTQGRDPSSVRSVAGPSPPRAI